MTFKVGFLHDYEVMDFGEVKSETDLEVKYSVAVEKTTNNLLNPNFGAELTVVDFNNETLLDSTNGYKVKVINESDIKSKHNSFRFKGDVENKPYLDVARFSLKDYTEGDIEKSHHEYWSQKDFSLIDEGVAGVPRMKGDHSTGESLLHAYCLYTDTVNTVAANAEIYVMRRDEATKTWTTVNSGNPIDTITRKIDSDSISTPCPTFLTIPNYGTFLFCFAFGRETFSPHNPEIIYYLSKDDGLTWNYFGAFSIEPFWGKIVPPVTKSIIDEKAVVLKATFYNNKIILGMMLQGTDAQDAPNLEELRSARMVNLVISEDLGKMWTTVPVEFISSSFGGPLPGENYNFGESDNIQAIPMNFGLGYDIHSDKIILAIRGSGVSVIDSTSYLQLENINKLFFFYNNDDSLFDWGVSIVNGKTYKLIDDFKSNLIGDKDLFREITDGEESLLGYYTKKDYTLIGKPNWEYREQSLYENGDAYISPYTPNNAYCGSHIVRIKEEDPTLHRTFGVRVEMRHVGKTNSFTCGFGFCRSDDDNFYAVTLAAPASNTMKIALQKVVAGVESNLDNITVPFNYAEWNIIDVVFDGPQRIVVLLNGLRILWSNDYSLQNGHIFLFNTGVQSIHFKNFGIITDNSLVNIPSGAIKGDHPDDLKRSFGQDINLSNDNFGNSWILLDSYSINAESAVYYIKCSPVLQRFRLERDIDRTEAKLTGKDKYVVKFGENADFFEDSGYYFSIENFGIFQTHTVANAQKFRICLTNFKWHKGKPLFFGSNLTFTNAESFVIEPKDLTNVNLRTIFNSYLSPLTYVGGNYGMFAELNGWDLSGAYAVDDYTKLRFTSNGSYIEQSYDYSTRTPNTYASRSVPVQYFDYKHRGVVVFFSTAQHTISYGAYRTIFEIRIPSILSFDGTDWTIDFIRLRLVEYAETGAGNKDGKYMLYSHNGSTWDLLHTVNLGALGVSSFSENMFFITPSYFSGTPRLNWYKRFEGQAQFTIITEDEVIQEYQETSTTSPSTAMIKFGCWDHSGGSNLQQFKIIAYSDTCHYDVSTCNLLGECAESGEYLYASKDLVLSVGGGVVSKGDEWTLTDTFQRSFSKENILLKPSSHWRSENNSANKSIVIDAGLVKEFNTVVLYDVNCMLIDIIIDDNINFSSPETYNLDMTEYSQTFSKAGDRLLKFTNVTDTYAKDQFANKLIATGNNSESVFRIVSSFDEYLVVEDDNNAVLPNSGTAYILSNRIAIKFKNSKQYRYIKITFKKGAYTQPTAETYFQLGQILIGNFDELQWNPEYPETIVEKSKSAFIKMVSGINRKKKLGKPTVERTLVFKAIDTKEKGFQQQLEMLWLNTEGGTRVFYYIPNIEEFTTTNYYYTFNVTACVAQNNFIKPLLHGSLSEYSITLRETN